MKRVSNTHLGEECGEVDGVLDLYCWVGLLGALWWRSRVLHCSIKKNVCSSTSANTSFVGQLEISISFDYNHLSYPV